jgi:hypothetical protein
MTSRALPSPRRRRIAALSRRGVLWAWLVMAAMAAALSAQEADAPSALGKDGAVYTVRPSQVAGSRVLALEVARPDGSGATIVVPGTEGPWPETAPSIVYQERSDTFFLLWHGYVGPINPALHIASYRDGVWSAVTQLLAGPWTEKSAPQLIATHDVASEVGGDGAKKTRETTVLHVVWAEETIGGYVTYYAPIVLVDGEYIGHHQLHRLDDFDRDAPAAVEFEIATAVQQAPLLRSGRDGRSVSVLFANATTRRLLSLEIDVLPRPLISLAEGARGHIIIWGVKNDLTKKAALAASVGQWVRANGEELLPEIVDNIAATLSAKILAETGTGPDDLIRLADQARGHIIIWGSRGRDRGLVRAASALEVAFTDLQALDPEAPRTAASLRFSLATSRLGFRTNGDAARLFLSPDATRAGVAWFDSANPVTVRYRLSQGNGWSEPQELPLTKGFTLERALTVIEQRVNRR